MIALREIALRSTADQVNRVAVQNIERNLSNEAILSLKKAISLEPANAEVLFLFSRAYAGMGNTEYAEKFYKSYLLFKKD